MIPCKHEKMINLHGFSWLEEKMVSLFIYPLADCEWKVQAGNVCVASFDWKCSGICRSVERMKEVHLRCGEDENALWSATL